MAFNGTARFKPGELVKYLESIGARFGPHVNAYTSYDETVYMLDVPTDRDGCAGARLRGAQRLCGRRHARREGNRSRARSRHRGVARSSGCRLAHAAAADRGALRRFPLRGPSADRHAGDPEGFPGAAPARLLPRLLSPGPHGRHRRGRHRSGGNREARAGILLAAARGRTGAADGVSDSCTPGDALRHRVGSRSPGLLGVRHPQASAASRSARSATIGACSCERWSTR